LRYSIHNIAHDPIFRYIQAIEFIAPFGGASNKGLKSQQAVEEIRMSRPKSRGPAKKAWMKANKQERREKDNTVHKTVFRIPGVDPNLPLTSRHFVVPPSQQPFRA
jgi:hypothetical protein